MSKDFNISMNCLILNWFVNDPSWMLHLSEFVRTLRSSVSVVFNNFLLIDATARSKISSDQKRFFVALSLYPLSFFANTPFNFLKSKTIFKSFLNSNVIGTPCNSIIKPTQQLLDVFFHVYNSICGKFERFFILFS